MTHFLRNHRLVWMIRVVFSLVFATHLGSQWGAGSAFGSGLSVCTPPVQPVELVNPTTVTDCTQSALQAALDAGGHIDFDCGPGPTTIPLSSQLELSVTADTVIDGGGLVTLDGQGLTRLLHKGWHDPNAVGEIAITLQNIRLINGRAPGGGSTGDHSGGAIAVGHPGTRLHILNSTLENNATTDVHTPDNQGGALFVHNSYETVISGSVLSANQAGNGGAMGGIATGLLVFNSRFTGNQAVDAQSGDIVRGYGGAIHLDGVTNSYNPNSLKRVHVCGSVFEGNSAVRGGGAMGVVVSDGKGTLATYERSTFIGNEVLGQNGNFGQGGGIYHIEDDHAGAVGELNLQILESTFHDNRARRQGGGVWVYILGRGEVANNTFEANTTTAPLNEVGQGGAMVVTLGLIDVTNTTFANNHAAYQAGALHGGGSGDPNRVITLKNTIFLNNTLNQQDLPSPTEWQGFHTNRPMSDGGQNIQHPRYKPYYGNEVNNNITASPIYADPLLHPLADNGGPTLTMALMPGSPAIDAGAPGCPPTDQRGVPREGTCDIGAFEFIASSIVVNPPIRAIPPGGSTTFSIHVNSSEDPNVPFDLALTNPNPELLTTLQPDSVLPGMPATLTVTDTHPGPELSPGVLYSLLLTASRGGDELTAEAQVLVGGGVQYLALVSR